MTFTRGDRVSHPEHGDGTVRESYSASRTVWVHFDKDTPTRGYGSAGVQYSFAPEALTLLSPSTLAVWERLWAF